MFDFVLCLAAMVFLALPHIMVKRRLVMFDDEDFTQKWVRLSGDDRLLQAKRMVAYHIGLRSWFMLLLLSFVMFGIGLCWWNEITLPSAFGQFVTALVVFLGGVTIFLMQPLRITRAAKECGINSDQVSNLWIDGGFLTAIGISLLIRYELVGSNEVIVICGVLTLLVAAKLWHIQRTKFAYASTIPHILS